MNLPGGNYIWSTTLTPIIEENLVSYIVGSAMDITERKKMELELQQYANYDQLTGLPNRRLFFERLKQLIIESKREKNQFALLFIDLDDFKGINDQYGHHVGDEVLINVGNRLLNCLRKSDTVARMGGDEFTILLRNVNNKESVHSLIKKIHKTLKKTIYLNSIECNINASIGVSIYPENGESSEGLLKYADSSMYAMKRKEPLC